MKLLTKKIKAQLKKNWENRHDEDYDPEPVVKFFHPLSASRWLITEQDQEDPDRLFGLCDLGHGFPELGYVSLRELQSVKVFGLGVERDLYFEPDKTLRKYADEARCLQYIKA